ncbi:MAG: hypothetical protein QXP91_09965 [Candidatus Methanomethylicia archaeon]
MGVVTEKPVKIIRGIKTIYSKDSEQDRGNIEINLKNGAFFIGYYYKGFGYVFHGKFPRKATRVETDECKLTKGKWIIEDNGCGIKVFEHEENEAEKPGELIEPKVTKSIPEATLEYYRKDKILKIPFDNDEIIINIENEYLEYIRNNKKIVKFFPLKNEIHFYGIKPEIKRFIVTSEGAHLINQS